VPLLSAVNEILPLYTVLSLKRQDLFAGVVCLEIPRLVDAKVVGGVLGDVCTCVVSLYKKPQQYKTGRMKTVRERKVGLHPPCYVNCWAAQDIAPGAAKSSRGGPGSWDTRNSFLGYGIEC